LAALRAAGGRVQQSRRASPERAARAGDVGRSGEVCASRHQRPRWRERWGREGLDEGLEEVLAGLAPVGRALGE